MANSGNQAKQGSKGHNSLMLDFPMAFEDLLDLGKQDILEICQNAEISHEWERIKEKTLLGRLITVLSFLYRQEEICIDMYGSDKKGAEEYFYSQLPTADRLIFDNHIVAPYYLVLKDLGYIEYATGKRKDRKKKDCRLLGSDLRSPTHWLSSELKQVDISAYLSEPKVEKLRSYFYPYSEEERAKWADHHQWLFEQIKLFELDSSVTEIFEKYPKLFKKDRQRIRVARSIEQFRTKQQIFKPNPKGVGRVFNSISGMKREEREYLRVCGGKLIKIDITAAQPYFLTSKFQDIVLDSLFSDKNIKRLRNDGWLSRNEIGEAYLVEIKTYWNLYKSGDFYQNFYKHLYGKDLVTPDMDHQEVKKARDPFKKAFFGTFISGNPYHVKNGHFISEKWTELREKMQEVFPLISLMCDLARNMDKPKSWTEPDWIDDSLIVDKSENFLDIDYTEFCNNLQQLEAKIIIDGVCNEIFKEHKFPVCPVHDCLIVEKHNERIIVDLINNHCLEYLDQKPNISVEGLGFKYNWNYK